MNEYLKRKRVATQPVQQAIGSNRSLIRELVKQQFEGIRASFNNLETQFKILEQIIRKTGMSQEVNGYSRVLDQPPGQKPSLEDFLSVGQTRKPDPVVQQTQVMALAPSVVNQITTNTSQRPDTLTVDEKLPQSGKVLVGRRKIIRKF